MTTTLALYFNAGPDKNVVHWLSIANGPAAADASACHVQDLGAIANTLAPQKTVVIVPGEHVLSTRVRLPSRASLQALPYIVEEKLAAPVEDVHIAHSIPVAKQILAFVIDAALLNHYLHSLKEQGIQADCLIADYQLLAAEKNVAQCATIGDRTLVRLPDGSGTALRDPQKLPSLLQNEGHKTETNLASGPLSLKDLLNRAAGIGDVVNLLQGSYAPRQSTHDRRKRHRWGIALTAASLLLVVGYFLTAGGYFRQRANELRYQAEQAYRDIYPEAQKVTDIRRQLEGHLKNSQAGHHAGSEFLALLARAAPALSTTGAHTIKHLRYNQQQQAMQLEVQSRDIAAVNQVQQALQNTALNAVILSANSNDAGVLARLKITTGQHL